MSGTTELPPLVPPRADDTTPVAAAYVTQRNSLAVLGLVSRAFREAVHKYRIPHTRLGKQVLVRIEDWHAAMSRIAKEGNPSEPAPYRTEKELLARWGVTKVR